ERPPHRRLDALVAGLHELRDFLGDAGRDVPGRDAVVPQRRRELLAGDGVPAMHQVLELADLRRPGEPEHGGARADPLLAQPGGLEVIAAVGGRVIVLGPFTARHGLHADHWVAYLALINT